MYFDPLYFKLMIPAMILAGIATLITKTTFAKYSEVAASSGMTGAQAAKRLLEGEGISDVKIEETGGFLSDHYDPTSKTLRLSPTVFQSNSLSAIGVACHEAGHAIQHAAHFGPLHLRSALVPATQIGSTGSYIFFILGLIFHQPGLVLIGVGLFSLVVVFSLVTLPVEWDASARAKRLMVSAGIVSPQEQISAGKVLNAAFMTYVASAISALLTLLYYLLRSGLLGGRRD